MKRWQAIPALSIVLFLMMTVQAVAAKPKYIGVEKCASCHKANYLAWKTSSHAKAFNILKPGKRKKAKLRADLDPEKDYTADKKCVKCHVTGYRKRGGFKDIESTPQMAGVGCESCHGPGSKYAVLHDKKMYGFEKSEATELGQLYGADDETVCLQCHAHKDSPTHEKLDSKYRWDWKEKLKVRKAYHPKSKKKSQFSF
ncbi:MAG: cytochrome c family protein [Candidatus Polarisedimenticolaceae bacterium]|nr:cytochrome c family protein [Candidatus Polarisedimenticolaceae bacterium]